MYTSWECVEFLSKWGGVGCKSNPTAVRLGFDKNKLFIKAKLLTILQLLMVQMKLLQSNIFNNFPPPPPPNLQLLVPGEALQPADLVASQVQLL